MKYTSSIRNYYWLKFLTLNLAFTLAGFFAHAQVKEQIFEHESILHGDSVVFPLTIINAFPFISVEVNGIKGKFMFDTGNRNAIEINDDMVPLKRKTASGNGSVGSGQTFTRSVNDTLTEVKFTNGYVYHNLLKVPSSNLKFLQTDITPDCIGYIGYDFFKGYTFKLDYLKRKLTFYKNPETGTTGKIFLKGEKVLAILDFTTRNLPNIPVMNVKIGGIYFLGNFDTGQYGILELSSDAKKALSGKETASVDFLGNDGYDDALVSVKNVMLDDKFITNVKGIYLSNYSQHVRDAIGITEPNIISFGYRFFEQYKTVWDYMNKKIYVLTY